MLVVLTLKLLHLSACADQFRWYPTPWYDSPGLHFSGITPVVSAQSTTCNYVASPKGQLPYVPLPSHIPWPATTAPPVVDYDPFGDTFSMDYVDRSWLSYSDILTYFPSNTALLAIYTECALGTTADAAQSWIGAAALIKTSTVTLSSAAASPTQKAASMTTESNITGALPTAQSRIAAATASATSTSSRLLTTSTSTSSQRLHADMPSFTSSLELSNTAPETTSSSHLTLSAVSSPALDQQSSTRSNIVQSIMPSFLLQADPSLVRSSTLQVLSQATALVSQGGSLQSNIADQTQSGQNGLATSYIQTSVEDPVFSLGSTIIAQGATSDQYNIGSLIYTMIQGGSPITADGTTLSLASDGSALIINGVSTNPALKQSTSPGQLIATVNSQSQIVVSSRTLPSTGAVVSVGSQLYSIHGSGSVRTLQPIMPTVSSNTVDGTSFQGVLASPTSLSSLSAVTTNGRISSLQDSGTFGTLLPVTSTTAGPAMTAATASSPSTMPRTSVTSRGEVHIPRSNYIHMMPAIGALWCLYSIV